MSPSRLNLARFSKLIIDRRAEVIVLVSVLLIVLGIWGFAELADEVVEGESSSMDEAFLKALRRDDDPAVPIGPSWVEHAARDITALGGTVVLLMVVFITCGYLWLERLYHAMWLVLGATIGGMMLSSALKWVFGRERPSTVPHLTEVHDASFPSGHSMLSAVTYLTLGALLIRMTKRWRIKIYILCIALGLTFLIGVSRLYMGVHYPTDVLAGWTAGLVWALLCWLAARYLQSRGAVEPEQ